MTSAWLARLACDPARSRGRLHVEVARGPRDAFQRDRDRIVHSVAFRRLRHKTQVFVAPDGDHSRVRLTHSLEVAQIGRTMARALGVNEDLTEALCLAHDIGHPPFGHSGEEALREAMAAAGGFDHNAHTLRLLTRLETPYPRFDGLNLGWETLEGLAKHNGPLAEPNWALAQADREFALDLSTWPGLEAQVAAIADDIAYDNHDIDDGLRAGLFSIEDILEVPFVAQRWERVLGRYPGVEPARLTAELIRDQIGDMVADVLAETGRRVAEAGVNSVEDVRAAGRPLAGFSAEIAAQERALKDFLYARMYRAPSILVIQARARDMVERLFAAYRESPALLPPSWRGGGADPVKADRRIGDFIAGMTDRYAIARYREIYGEPDLPDIF